MLTIPFLTDLDDRAKVKGSRDPLGVQGIWSVFGRKVVGNLTTVSTSIRDFTTLILGYYLAERAAERGPSKHLDVFLRWEQLAAYARGGINSDWRFRGTDRAKARWNSDGRIRLSARTEHCILSDQKTYGLWGLYTVPARSSGLVEGEPTRVTAPARQLVDEVYEPLVRRHGYKGFESIVDSLARSETPLSKTGADRKLLECVAEMLRPRMIARERSFYRDALLVGGPRDRTGGLQGLLADLVESGTLEATWEMNPQSVRSLARRARKAGELGGGLATHLERIVTCESLLAPASALFNYLLGQDGQSLRAVQRGLASHWGAGVPTIDVAAFESVADGLSEALPADSRPDLLRDWLGLARALATGAYDRSVDALLRLNAVVMLARGSGAAWIETRDGKISVRFRDEPVRTLPERNALRGYWRHSYFLDSLREIALGLKV